MKNKILYVLLLMPFLGFSGPTPGSTNDKPVPIDQYDYTLIIAAVLILAISAAYMMSKKLKKA